MRRLAPLAVLVALIAPASADAQSTLVDETVNGLQTSPVYVHQDAEERITSAEAQELADLIAREQAGPMYIAIVPQALVDEAGGSAEEAIFEIGRALDRPGTYAIVAGDRFRAGATPGVLDRGVAGRLATDAFEIHGDDGVFPTLKEFVSLVGEARRNGGEPPPKGPGAGGFGGLGLLALLGGGAALIAVSRNRRRRRETEAQVAELRETAKEDLVALGGDIRALDLDIEMPAADQAAKDDYERALTRYEQAERALDRARDPADFAPIGEALEEGRWAMASAKARLKGEPPPERHPPCFFDPRHGPSTRDVEWAPDGYGAPRLVPVCEADAVRLESGQEPMTREIVTQGRRVPYYDAPGWYGPYAGGFYGGFTGFLPGLLFGSMLGGAFGGWGAHDASAADFGSGGPGDFGGGGFGGGDFGGGGFGDFGGGDFGGGGDF
ncbi:MAG TPA: hypothetical protein VF529_19555 [Solirubrobacteraceae bacterium]